MRLSELLQYDKIYIQCHNNPDPDSIASAYGIYCYLKAHDVKATIFYAGPNHITKSNLSLMIDTLDIPIEYFPDEMNKVDGLLLTVDCQYGQGNVDPVSAKAYACIDHHKQYVENPMSEIRSYLGSCSTLIWDMLRTEGFSVQANKNLSTALYYGLMTDTGNFIENLHPLDRDMKDSLTFDKNLITRFINSNISIKELEIAGIALIRHIYNDDHRFAVVHSAPCDPNILGLISDLVLTVDKIDTCVVYNDTDNGYKLSVRSCIKEVRANELVSYLTEDIGSGGGHDDKAGGFILLSAYEEYHPTINTETFFGLRMTKYFDECEIIYADKYSIDIEGMEKYRESNVTLGYVDATRIVQPGTVVTLRSIDEDTDIIVDNKSFIMIGTNGSVYPISREEFSQLYMKTRDTYISDAQYPPTFRSRLNDEIYSLERYAWSCMPKEERFIYAKQLDKKVKVFTLQNNEKYQLGNVGDYIICDDSNHKNVRIIKKEVFNTLYEK